MAGREFDEAEGNNEGKGKRKEEGKEGPSCQFKPFKGEGKGGSLGIPLGSVGSALAMLQTQGKEVMIPPAPETMTREAVQELFDNGYFNFPPTPFWDGKEIWKVVKGYPLLVERRGHR